MSIVGGEGEHMEKFVFGRFDASTKLNAHDCEAYGYEIDTIQTSERNFYVWDVGAKELSFRVNDDKEGIKTVAAALGYGMSKVSERDDCVDLYREFGMHQTKHGFTYFEEPVLLLSKNTSGYRVVWDGMLQAYTIQECVNTEHDWTVDVYCLRTNLPAGGVLIQSSKSAAVLKAEKFGKTWELTLTLPMLRNGITIGSSYQSVFCGAYNWYKKRQLKAN